MGIRTLVAGVAMALVLAAPVAADRTIKLNDNLAVVVPTGSPVTYSSYKKDDITATFKGTFVMTGTYHIPFGGDGATDYGDPWFEPDAPVLATLPYWKSYRLKATHISFDNVADFVKAAVPNFAKLNHGKAKTLSGHAAIKVNAYAMNITCDYPYYFVHFLSVEKPATQLARRGGTEEEGC